MDVDATLDNFYRLAMSTTWHVTLSTGTHVMEFTAPDKVLWDNEQRTVSIGYDPKIRRVSLSIYGEDAFLLFLGTFDVREGKFVGRDRTTRSGYGHAVPDALTNELLDAARLDRRTSRSTKASKQPDVLYLEDLGPVYPVGDYDIVEDFPHVKKRAHLPAICIVGCNRPAYMTKVVQALAQTPEAAKWPVYVFLDKPTDASQYYMTDEQVLEIMRNFPLPMIIRREQNFGCGRNLIDARVQLFDKVGHSRVYMFEDDLVPNPQYITMCENMWNWVDSSNFRNVGAIQGWEWCQLSAVTRALHTDYVRATMSNWWGYSMSKECWDDISPLILEYQDKYLKGRYSDRPHRTILEWLMKLANSVRRTQASYDSTHEYVPQLDYERLVQRYFSGPPTGQDAVTMMAMHVKGWLRLAPVVNRGQYIGKEGIHMTPAAWRQHGYHLISTKEYPEDTERTDFIQQIQYIADADVETNLAGLQTFTY